MGGHSVRFTYLVVDIEIYLTRAIGTGVSLYGRTGIGGGILNLLFDGVVQKPVYLNTTDPLINSTLLWHVEGKDDGDHQVFGYTSLADRQGVANIWLDGFE